MQQPVEVFRATRHRACEERSFMLLAVGIDSLVQEIPGGFALLVEQPMHAHAQHHLWQYEQERQRPPPLAAKLQPHPGAWRGSLVYALVLLVPPILLAQRWFVGDPYDSGVMNPTLVRAGEWWRAFTALTLHWDAAHLLGNVGGGALLGHSAAQYWGNCRAWLLIVVAAVCSNFIEALVGRTDYVSAGASTAVFAALGLVAAYAWRTRGRHFGTPLTRWAPLIAGAVLLGLFGAGSSVPVAGMPQPDLLPFETPDSTNVLSHVLGFLCGVLAGVVAASALGARVLKALPAWLAGSLAIGSIALAWIAAA